MYLSFKFEQVLSIEQKFGHGYCHGKDFAHGFVVVSYISVEVRSKIFMLQAQCGDAALFLHLGAIRTL